MTCVYSDVGGNYYTCEMRIDDENGTDEILGEHNGTKSDEDVRRVQVVDGSSRNFPKFICEKFVNLDTIEVDIQELKMQEISEDSFKTCENLKELNLVMNEEVEIHPKAFENTKNLRQLKLLDSSDTTIISWNPTWFQSMHTLKDLTISDRRLAEIPRNAFNASLTFIKIEDANQKIQELNYESFGNLKNLDHLEVRSREIKSLDFNIFDQPEALRKVIFEITKCKSVRFEVTEFHKEKIENLRDLEMCFKAFDSRVIGEGKICKNKTLIAQILNTFLIPFRFFKII